MKKLARTIICEICGQPRGRFVDHSACSKIKQAEHANDPRPQKTKRLTADNQDFMTKRYGDT